MLDTQFDVELYEAIKASITSVDTIKVFENLRDLAVFSERRCVIIEGMSHPNDHTSYRRIEQPMGLCCICPTRDKLAILTSEIEAGIDAYTRSTSISPWTETTATVVSVPVYAGHSRVLKLTGTTAKATYTFSPALNAGTVTFYLRSSATGAFVALAVAGEAKLAVYFQGTDIIANGIPGTPADIGNYVADTWYKIQITWTATTWSVWVDDVLKLAEAQSGFDIDSIHVYNNSLNITTYLAELYPPQKVNPPDYIQLDTPSTVTKPSDKCFAQIINCTMIYYYEAK